MSEVRPNVLLIMTDEERYPPPYEDEALAEYRRTHLPARQRLRDQGLELHRHYVGSTACLPSRATLFTGQYPSLHGVTNTDGMAKSAADPMMTWLDPDTVPTMGDWFRAAGYRTHYRGKWHISHADLLTPGTHQAPRANQRDGSLVDDVVDAYRRADRLDPFGFGGWIGREPHGADPADTGIVRDPIFAEQVAQLFTDLAEDRDAGPWMTVASLVNPHDIAFSGFGWEALGFPPTGDTVPDIAAAPSQDDSLDDRPTAQRLFREAWPSMLYPQPTDLAYRRFYYWLHELVDTAIARILDALDASGLADDTIVVFTSDHGDLLGAHGGLQQKWHNGYDEALRVPFVVSGPGVDVRAAGIDLPTSHLDLLPTLLGLIGADAEELSRTVAEHHIEAHPLVGRDLSGVITGSVAAEAIDAPVYFMTEDQISRGLRTSNRFTNEPFEAVGPPAKVESVIARLDTGADGRAELWKLNRYYDELAPDGSDAGENGEGATPVESQWELHNLTIDPEERTNRATTDSAVADRLRTLLDTERTTKRRTPTHVL
ncbi:MAG: sulfatase-like hydrolase/transferase [Acidimicrobiales bacterium]